MNYLVSQSQLYNLFSTFIERWYGEIHYSHDDKQFYHYDNKGRRVVIGFNDDGHFYFSYYGYLNNYTSMADTLGGMFGDNFTELMLMYLKENFKDIVTITGVE